METKDNSTNSNEVNNARKETVQSFVSALKARFLNHEETLVYGDGFTVTCGLINDAIDEVLNDFLSQHNL